MCDGNTCVYGLCCGNVRSHEYKCGCGYEYGLQWDFSMDVDKVGVIPVRVYGGGYEFNLKYAWGPWDLLYIPGGRIPCCLCLLYISRDTEFPLSSREYRVWCYLLLVTCMRTLDSFRVLSDSVVDVGVLSVQVVVVVEGEGVLKVEVMKRWKC